MRFSLRSLLIVISVLAILLAASPYALKWHRWRKCCQELANFSQTDYLEYGYQEVQDAAEPIFDRLLADLQSLSFAADVKEKTALFKRCTEELANLDGDVETVEREEFAETTFTIARMIDLDLDVDEYRDWRDN